MKLYKKLSNKVKKNNQRSKFSLGTFVKGSLTVVISVLIIYGVVQAGTITPPSGTPTAQFYTLSEIYEFITNNTTATESGHDFTFSDALAGTGHTLTEIYSALANLISADQVRLGTTYLNVAGTLVPSGGNATVADVLAGKTFFGDSQADWNLQTGTMTNVGAQTITPGTSTTTITQGYHDGAGYCEGDADLVSGNIKSGANIFGINGDGNVVDTSSGDATASDIVSNKIAWVDGAEITGSFASSTATATTEGEEITPSAGTWLSKVTVAITNLIASVIKSGETVGEVDGELTPASGASESLTAINAFCGHKYFGSGAFSWTVQSGTGCAVCKECVDSSCVNMTNDTQDTTDDLGIAGVCNQICKKCSGGSCVNQSSNEDLFAQCGGSSCCGYCDGSGSCAYVANGSTCATPGDSCSGDYKCDGSGTCEYSPWSCGDALAYAEQNYDTVLIGTGETAQCWFAEDLNVGTMLCEGGGETCATEQSDDNVLEKYCYQNNTDYCTSDGALYQWAEAMDLAYACNANNSCAEQINTPHQGICPTGWHIPTDDEYKTLEMYLGMSQAEADAEGWRGTHNEGDKLKIASKCHSGQDCGTSKFESLLAGYRNTNGSFSNRGTYAYIWSSVQSSANAWRRRLGSGLATVARDTYGKLYGFSVRCLKD